jgi:hypothetical protein
MTAFPWPADFVAVEHRAMRRGYYIAVNAELQYELRQRFSAPPVVVAGPFVAWADCCAALDALISPVTQLDLFTASAS